VLPVELSRVDGLLDDPVFFAPFAAYFDARIGRPSIPMETYLRLMFLKFRYRLGHEALCREVGDSISWQRFCRIPFGTRVPHPTTLMKITTRCGDAAVSGLNEALLAKAAESKLLRTDKVRADTTVVEADVATRLIQACWRRRSALWPAPWSASRPQVVRRARDRGTDGEQRVDVPARSPASCGFAASSCATRRRLRCAGSPANLPISPNPQCVTLPRQTQRQAGTAARQRPDARPAAARDQRLGHDRDAHAARRGADPQPAGRRDT